MKLSALKDGLKKTFFPSPLAGIAFLVFFLLVAWAYFGGLSKLSLFTYDQARDALYIKRLFAGKLRLIGTQSSIPGLYTAPFYYYLFAPFLALFRFDPAGVDFGVAFFSLLAVGLLFALLRQKTRFSVALVFSTLYAFAPAVVNQSRFAWNPNPLPFFTLLFVWFLKKALVDRRQSAWPGVAFALGAAINLHYSGVALLFSLVFVLLFFRPKVSLSVLAKSFLVFALFFLPLALFDLRHGFVNSQSLWRYFLAGTGGEIPPPPFWSGLGEKLSFLSQLLWGPVGDWGLLFSILFLFAGGFLLPWRQTALRQFFLLALIISVSGLIFTSFYRGSFFSFYLTFLYPLPFLLGGLLADKLLSSRRWGVVFLCLLFLLLPGRLKKAFVFSAVDRRPLLTGTAAFLTEHLPAGPYNLVAAYHDPGRYDRNAVDYRYFLHLATGNDVPDWDVLDYQNAQTVFLISEGQPVVPEELDFWELSLFRPFTTADSWELPSGVIIYELRRS